MTFELNKLDTSLIPEWIKEIEEIFQKLKEEKLSENKKKYDYVIEFM